MSTASSLAASSASDLPVDRALRDRAAAVIPGGMYGHQNAANLPSGFPQFLARGEGARIWDVDGNEYVDLMCAYGPMLLGHRHPVVEAAAARQAQLADCMNGPGPVMVELAERLVDIVSHADWVLLAKNGTDATTLCVTVARAATGRRKIALARGAYHGAAPWCTPNPLGTTPEDKANQVRFVYNDAESLVAALEEAGDELAAVVVSPFRHDARFDQELVDPAWARLVRAECDARGAALILDDVRCGFRLAFDHSWAPIGVDPDLSAWSKAIANGHPLAAVAGNDRYREAASKIYATGSFWFSAVPMAASLATLDVLASFDAVGHLEAMGQRLRDGLAAQAASHGVAVTQSGPVQMPFLSFVGDRGFERANCWTAAAAQRGAYLHPWHNWFLSTAHQPEDIDRALAATDDAFVEVRRRFGSD